MKISKSLSLAIAAGIVMGTTSSCGTKNNPAHTEDCPVNCEVDHAKEKKKRGAYCPACGMG